MHSHNHLCPNCNSSLDSISEDTFSCSNEDCSVKKAICNNRLSDCIISKEEVIDIINNICSIINSIFEGSKIQEIDENSSYDEINEKQDEIRDLIDIIVRDKLSNESKRIKIEKLYENLMRTKKAARRSINEKEVSKRRKTINGVNYTYDEIIVYTVISTSNENFSLVYCGNEAGDE